MLYDNYVKNSLILNYLIGILSNTPYICTMFFHSIRFKVYKLAVVRQPFFILYAPLLRRQSPLPRPGAELPSNRAKYSEISHEISGR